MNYEKEIHNCLIQIQADLAILRMGAVPVGGYLPRKYVLRFLDIGDTTLNSLEKAGRLTVSKVGRRKFYSVESITALLHSGTVPCKNVSKMQ